MSPVVRADLRLALAWLLLCCCAARDGATPCAEAGTCGGNWNAPPTHAAITYSGYAHMDVSNELVSLDRAPFGNEGSDARLTSPGATISFRSDAHRVQVIIDYRGARDCLADCPRTSDGKCYQPTGATCPNQCEVAVDIDGKRVHIPATNLVNQPLTHDHKQRDMLGEVKLALMDQADASKPATHTYKLTLPWGAPVALRRIHLEHPSGVDALPQLLPVAGAGGSKLARPKLVAFGDALTLGWCAERSYAHVLGELNGWDVVNLGFVGEKVQPEHGAAVGGQRGDMVLVMVGGSVWDSCLHADVTSSYRELLRNIRGAMSDKNAPLVAVTPTLSWREDQRCTAGSAGVTPADTRRQIGAAVEATRAAGDANLHLVHGPLLVPPQYFTDGLHPGEHGMRELALNLNAQLGFSRVRYNVVRCPVLTIAISGLEPQSALDVYWGGPAQAAGAIVEAGANCAGRSLMLSPAGRVAATADADGSVSVTVPAINQFDTCHATLFEIIEGHGCSNSRLGHVSSTFSSIRGTPAEKWTHAAASPPPPPPISWPPLWPTPHAHDKQQPQQPQTQTQPWQEAQPSEQHTQQAHTAKPQEPKHPHTHPPSHVQQPPPPPSRSEGKAAPKPAAANAQTTSPAASTHHAVAAHAPPPPPRPFHAHGVIGFVIRVYGLTFGVLMDSKARDSGGVGRLAAVACAGGITGVVAMLLGCLIVACYAMCRRGARGRRGRRFADDDEDAQTELMPVSFEVDGSPQMLLAIDIDRCKSFTAVRQALCLAYADVSGEQLLPSSMLIEYEDEANGFCFCRLESNGPIVDGRLRSARSLHVTASGAGKAKGRAAINMR